MIDAADAAAAPIHIVNSGPSMAPLAGRHYAGLDDPGRAAIVADTGGTTFDVSIVRNGQIPTRREIWIGPRYRGIMAGFPWVDVKSVGAGGGSIARLDSGGLLNVGPASAGAVPGQAAYGRGGTEPTVTDASVILGHIDPALFLGGSMPLDAALAEVAIAHVVADPMGISVPDASEAVPAIATENMVQASLDITVKPGIGPREAVLTGGGGAAGLNSVKIARRQGCPGVIVPDVGAALSAAGALMSDLKAEYHADLVTQTTGFDHGGVANVLTQLRAQCDAFAKGPGAGAEQTQIGFRVDARYATQVWEIGVPLRTGTLADAAAVADFVEDFHQTHEDLFSFRDAGSAIEIIGWTAHVTCRIGNRTEIRLAPPQAAAPRPARQVHFPDGWQQTPVHRFETMAFAHPIAGTAIIESDFATVVIDPGATARRMPSGKLVIDAGSA